MNSILPEEIILEILSRTSLSSFDAFRSTSKEMNKLTYDSQVLNMHSQRNHMVSGVIVQKRIRGSWYAYNKEFVPSSRVTTTLDLSFIPDGARIVASAEQGILVLETEKPDRAFYVCKPATKQLIQLPMPPNGHKTNKLALVVMGSKPLRYKIVRFSSLFGYKGNAYCCEILDSSESELKWRLLDPIHLPDNLFDTYLLPVTARGNIYIRMMNCEILKFDAYLEKWTTLWSPIRTRWRLQFYGYTRLLKYEGKLAYVCKQNQGLWEIWVLGIDESWVKTCVFDMKRELGRLQLGAFCDSNTCVIRDSDRVLYYRFKGSCEGEPADEDFVRLTSSQPEGDEIFLFRSDFDLID